MSELFAPHLEALLEATRGARLSRRLGRVRSISGLTLVCDGPQAGMGELVQIASCGGGPGVLAEVVAVSQQTLTLMAYGSIQGLAAGCEVEAIGEVASVGVGEALLGRVVDGFGEPIDGGPGIQISSRAVLEPPPINPMERSQIRTVLETGIRSIDAMLTLGRGQRVGIFSGSGVGKTTLLGMIARHVVAEVNVIALIGERGREVREFIDKQLSEDARRRSIVVVATADQPAPMRVRAAYAALAIAEYFRSQGKHVLLTMDSITRFAMARREIGLAAGEPPTARGYTPSVFAELPRLAERCGTHPSGGAITALMTVLVDGDDLNEPLSDCLRATLDAHIVLSRDLAQAGQFPAVDVQKSVSRVMSDVVLPQEIEQVRHVLRAMALIERNRQIVDIGAYVAGTHPALDAALQLREPLRQFFTQASGGVPRHSALEELSRLSRIIE